MPDGDVFGERLARHAVEQRGLTAGRQIRQCQHSLDVLLARAVEDRRREVDTLAEVREAIFLISSSEAFSRYLSTSAMVKVSFSSLAELVRT